jgi:uncharacterized HhH-GPD family protein
MGLHLAQDPAADALLSRSAFALLIGMLLDQQVPMEWAFSAPGRLAERLGHDPDPVELAGYDPTKLVEIFTGPPALHRFPGAMAGRVQALAAHLVEKYDGDATAVWADARSGEELRRRLEALPGFGRQKAQIFLALLGKQLKVRPAGWRQAAGGYGEAGVFRSVADVTSADTLAKVRSYKKQLKAAAKRG